MNKIEIEVPINVRYISDWLDFNVDLLKGHSIINKTITGCGFTHYCLTNSIPTILCSPRKFLLENKHEQLPNTYLVINEGEKSLEVDDDETKGLIDPLSQNEDLNDINIINNLENNLRSYIFNCQFSNIAPKILVTYDSLKHVLSVLGEIISYYSVIVDEFQNIFMDASFKPDVELSFIETLQDCPNVTYLSATPYIEEYLNELDEFKLLPYYELKWHPDRLQTIKVDPKKTFNISKEIDKIIQDYLSGRFPEKVDESGIVHQSKEVVFYTNSVKLITSTIKRNNLEPNQVNIICADTDKNEKVLKKIGFNIGKSPMIGEPHKMFTFCTRTTYAGADFYSTSAMSVIISDCKIDSLVTDIRMDFPQIMGRQRLKENVFRDECIFIYKLSDNSITMEEFEKLQKTKLDQTKIDLENFYTITSTYTSSSINKNKLLQDFRWRIKTKKYKDDYTGINERTGEAAINKLVLISEKRAFELRSNVYKSEVQVYNEFAKVTTSDLSLEDLNKKIDELNKIKTLYSSKGSTEVKLKAVCDILLNPYWFGHIHISDFYWLPIKHRNLLNLIGPERLRANGYKESAINREINLLQVDEENLIKLITSKFLVGERYTLKIIKEELRQIYSQLGLAKTAKASDLLDYFIIKEVGVYDSESKKQSKGYEIISLKE